MSPPRFRVALLCAPVFGAASVAAGDPGVTGYRQGKGTSAIRGAAGPNAQGSAASGWVKNALMMLH